jgi:hypothetical protein
MITLDIPYSGSVDAAIAEITTILPPEDIVFFGKPARRSRFAVSLIAGMLHVQIPPDQIGKAEEIEEAIASLPLSPAPPD